MIGGHWSDCGASGGQSVNAPVLFTEMSSCPLQTHTCEEAATEGTRRQKKNVNPDWTVQNKMAVANV